MGYGWMPHWYRLASMDSWVSGALGTGWQAVPRARAACRGPATTNHHNTASAVSAKRGTGGKPTFNVAAVPHPSKRRRRRSLPAAAADDNIPSLSARPSAPAARACRIITAALCALPSAAGLPCRLTTGVLLLVRLRLRLPWPHLAATFSAACHVMRTAGGAGSAGAARSRARRAGRGPGGDQPAAHGAQGGGGVAAHGSRGQGDDVGSKGGGVLCASGRVASSLLGRLCFRAPGDTRSPACS